MAEVTGQRMPLPLPRRWIADLLHASRRIPTVTVERTVRVAAVAAARRRLAHPPAWVLLFTKAYAIVAARRPELRRAYLPFPWPHLFQADESVASVAVEREYHGEPAVFFGHIRHPDRQPLRQLMAHLHRWRTHPVEHIRSFHRLIKYGRYPRPIRRLMCWYAANVCKKWRMRVFGTFGVSVTAGDGATALNLISPLSTALNYGVFGPDHSLPVRVHFDHRVMDGAPVARALVELEEVMNGPIVSELRELADAPGPVLYEPLAEAA
jgi:hypothetical protein